MSLLFNRISTIGDPDLYAGFGQFPSLQQHQFSSTDCDQCDGVSNQHVVVVPRCEYDIIVFYEVFTLKRVLWRGWCGTLKRVVWYFEEGVLCISYIFAVLHFWLVVLWLEFMVIAVTLPPFLWRFDLGLLRPLLRRHQVRVWGGLLLKNNFLFFVHFWYFVFEIIYGCILVTLVVYFCDSATPTANDSNTLIWISVAVIFAVACSLLMCYWQRERSRLELFFHPLSQQVSNLKRVVYRVVVSMYQCMPIDMCGKSVFHNTHVIPPTWIVFEFVDNRLMLCL